MKLETKKLADLSKTISLVNLYLIHYIHFLNNQLFKKVLMVDSAVHFIGKTDVCVPKYFWMYRENGLVGPLKGRNSNWSYLHMLLN